jgi:hypothetical protein
VLLAVGGVASAALSVMPDAYYRLLAYPNGIAMIGLGYSMWSTARYDDGWRSDRMTTMSLRRRPGCHRAAGRTLVVAGRRPQPAVVGAQP